MSDLGAWERAQDWELDWHGDAVNSFHEEEKQLVYAARMGLKFVQSPKTPYVLDMKGATVIDVGAGPYSLLLKAINFAAAFAVDPLMDRFPQWVRERYLAHGVQPVTATGEEMFLPKADEVFLYNVLEHTQDPQAVVKNALRHCGTLRLFEWIETRPNMSHPHVQTAELLDEWLGQKGRVEYLNQSGCYGKAYHGVFRGETL